jgi:hypothetical protein
LVRCSLPERVQPLDERSRIDDHRLIDFMPISHPRSARLDASERSLHSLVITLVAPGPLLVTLGVPELVPLSPSLNAVLANEVFLPGVSALARAMTALTGRISLHDATLESALAHPEIFWNSEPFTGPIAIRARTLLQGRLIDFSFRITLMPSYLGLGDLLLGLLVHRARKKTTLLVPALHGTSD